MIIENISTRKERELKSQELVEVIGGLPTDLVPLSIAGGITSGVGSLVRQLSDDGSVDGGTFLRDVNVGIVTGATASLLTPF